MNNNDEYLHQEFIISTEKNKLDHDMLYSFLGQTSYWAKNIPEKTFKDSIENSLCFGVYKQSEQIGFARVITDKSTFAYLADVFILPDFRGRGLSKWLMHMVINHEDLQGLRRWMLVTNDAHSLYAQFGFTLLSNPEFFMEIVAPYQKNML